MSILKVARMGRPVLRERASEIAPERIAEPETQRLIDDLIETMREYSGVGLAGPQVHARWRVFVWEVGDNPRYPGREPTPLGVAINPSITPLGEAVETDWEGCLSIPDIRGQVTRPARMRLEALDREGRAYSRELAGFEARVAQHEFDHLDGVLFLDRMTDLRSLAFTDEIRRW